jgi:hypothetical protein
MVLLSATIVVNGQETQERSISSFNGLKVSEGIDVYLKKGPKESLRLEVRGTSVDNVITEVSGGYLRIHMREGHYRDRSVKVYVTYVKLEKISASSAANVFSSETLKGERLVISASSAASVDLPVDVKNLDISASSAADVELKGVAQSVDLDVSSAGEIDTYDLEADDVSSTASSAGSIKLSVKKSIRAHASSGGTIRYRGNPSQSNTNSSSGGSVRKIN